MVNENYNSVDGEDSPLVQSNDEAQAHDHLSFLKKNALVLMALACFAAFVTGSGHWQPLANKTKAELRAPILTSSQGPRDCTLTECYAAGCDPASAPYVCLIHNGGPHGGCSAIPWVVGTCEVQCNLGICASLSIPADAPSCKNVYCGQEWCGADAVKCGYSAPYLCKDGSAYGGCTEDEYGWSLKAGDNICSDCCDVTAC